MGITSLIARRPPWLVAALMGMPVLVVGVSWALWIGFGPTGADSRDPAVLARGRQIYAGHCAQCHGATLEGQPNWRERRPDGRLPAPPHDAEGHTWHHPDRQLFDLIRHGMAPVAPPGYVSDMPAFAGTLTDREIGAVLAFIKSTWPEDIRAKQARLK